MRIVLIAAGLAAVLGVAEAQTVDQQEVDGRMVEIGPDRGAGGETNRRELRRDRRLTRPGFVEQPRVVSRYMIGIGGRPLPPEVRAQVDLEPNEGLLVGFIDPNGPAAEAGVERYDIIRRANGKPINNIADLAEIVGEQGELRGKITLDLLRRGRPEAAWVEPVERPLEAQRQLGQRQLAPRRFEGGFGGAIPPGFGEELFGAFGDDLFDRDFGGLIEGFGLERGEQNYVFAGPDGQVSVRVSRENDGPGQVTIQRGEEQWEFPADDQGAIERLPEEVRPFVERVLRGQPGGFGAPGPQGGLRLRLGELQQRMREMERLADDMQRELQEAPPFQAAEPQPVAPEEVEIPAGL